MAPKNTPKLAVLIDADNAPPYMSQALLSEKKQLLKYSIQPIQQFAYTHGKNATDMAMIIDAMDLLYSDRFDGFCLVSSDSDFTRLAVRIREAGLSVYGFGNRTTPEPFVVACSRFIYTENITLKTAVDAASDDNGWASLADVGSLITKRHSDFDPRSYGFHFRGV
ncbi:NYN domain-containing protein [Cladorrhinum sp. PSN259]|nr:NYN domain-containing protein [Cladorrhinum sp. PSN259]